MKKIFFRKILEFFSSINKKIFRKNLMAIFLHTFYIMFAINSKFHHLQGTPIYYRLQSPTISFHIGMHFYFNFVKSDGLLFKQNKQYFQLFYFKKGKISDKCKNPKFVQFMEEVMYMIEHIKRSLQKFCV